MSKSNNGKQRTAAKIRGQNKSNNVFFVCVCVMRAMSGEMMCMLRVACCGSGCDCCFYCDCAFVVGCCCGDVRGSVAVCCCGCCWILVVVCWMCCDAVMLMRCVVARAVREFLSEPESRSGGRSATASDFEKKPKTCEKHDLGPLMRVPSDAH